jgi:hypothetical protein
MRDGAAVRQLAERIDERCVLRRDVRAILKHRREIVLTDDLALLDDIERVGRFVVVVVAECTAGEHGDRENRK